MADADPVDPKPEIEEACGHHCVKAKAELEACTERVNKILADAKPGDDAVAHCTGHVGSRQIYSTPGGREAPDPE
ncbi:hypothetical protein T484DRAFT_1779569 [Baffinella frigidus]|nr:hypothetical protein T484DRAFT_1779569 [Cryptophyta sp. CCMP2293]